MALLCNELFETAPICNQIGDAHGPITSVYLLRFIIMAHA
jgi:hypothetical protein